MTTIPTSELFWVILTVYVFFVLGADYFLQETINQQKTFSLVVEGFLGG